MLDAVRRTLVGLSSPGDQGVHRTGNFGADVIVRQALGDVPLVGFFASGEIARHHLYGYMGVLTVFVENLS
ncbi:MAG: hypothetical protein Q4G70_00445 [Pseudomonadota bacterium]|nr:hypothetical protein [Pseudomonadota bacterium]